MKLRRTSALLLAAVTGLGVSIAQSPPAHAFSQAAFPLVTNHNRGVDVQTLQYLLQANGYSVTADGNFGDGTLKAVKAFQSKKGLKPDGEVGALTWGKLAVTVKNGNKGAAVKALQVQLNKKRSARLTVDGNFGGGTETAVKAFQSHAGIGPDGIVGATTWRNLLWHYAYPSWSHMCDKDPDNNGTANWGTGSAIGALEAAAARFHATGQGKVPIGDISREHGGALSPHVSHRVGVDVDVQLPRKDNAQCTAARATWKTSTYDQAATRQLVQAIRATAPGHIALIFFNDPQLIKEGLTTYYANHDNHLHVRYN